MKISFCTTRMGRAHHLKETLPQNICDNPASKGLDVEFVVLNYNSQDDLHEWIMDDSEMQKHVESGLICYGKTTDPEFFHMSHAKNMSHRLATGDVLCNLDADNFLGKGFAKMLYKHFADDMDIVMSPSHRAGRRRGADDRGFLGRIATSRKDFYKLNGYDESFIGWGGEDNNFLQRAKALGAKHLRFENASFLEIIRHTNEDRVANMGLADQKSFELDKIKKILGTNGVTLKRIFDRIRVLAKPIHANLDGDFGQGKVTLSNGQVLALEKMPVVRSAFNICACGISELVRGRISPRLANDQEEAHNSPEIFELN